MNAVKWPRLFTTATLVAVIAVVSGCDSSSNDVAENACLSPRGIYETSDLAFESTQNPDVRETFNENTSLRLSFAGTYYRARFISPQQDTTFTEDYYTLDKTASPVRITLGEESVIPGAEVDAQSFTCEPEGLGFKLNSDQLGYDVDKNGEVESTQFSADFELLSR